MEQNNLFGSDSTEWNQSETTQKLSDSMAGNIKAINQKKLPNMDSSNNLSDQTKVEKTMSEYVSEFKQKKKFNSGNSEGRQSRRAISSFRFPNWTRQVCSAIESPSYLTTADGKEDHVTECSMSPTQLSTVLTHEEQIGLIPGATVSAEEDKEISESKLFNSPIEFSTSRCQSEPPMETALTQGNNEVPISNLTINYPNVGYIPEYNSAQSKNCMDIQNQNLPHGLQQHPLSIKEDPEFRVRNMISSTEFHEKSSGLLETSDDESTPSTKIRKINVFQSDPTKKIELPKDLKLVVSGAFAKFQTRIFADEDDFTEQILEKLENNMTRLQNDYLVFDNDMNIRKGCQSDMWSMIKQFLSQNPEWWTRLKQVALHQDNHPIRSSGDKDAPSDRDIIREWIRKMWDNNTDQTLTKKLLRVFQAEFPEDVNDIVVQFDNIYGHIKNLLGRDTDVELPRIRGELQQPGSNKVDLTYLLTSIRLIQQLAHNKNMWSSVTPAEMEDVLFPSHFNSRNSRTMSIRTGLKKLKKKMISQAEQLKLETSSIFETEENDNFNKTDVSEKVRDAVFLNLQQITEAAFQPTEKQMRLIIQKNNQTIQRDSVDRECSRPRCQFPARCFWTRMREQEATESPYIINQCLQIQETTSRIEGQLQEGISQDNISSEYPSLPATGLKMTDLDSQFNTSTPIKEPLRSGQSQNRLSSSQEGELIESRENTNESNTNNSITISDNEYSPQNSFCQPKDKVTVIPFPKLYTVRYIENVSITPGITQY